MTRKAAEKRLAPVPREWLDVTMPGFRTIVGAAFVVFSAYATVFLFASDVAPIFVTSGPSEVPIDRTSLGVLADRYWLGILVAFGLFAGEVYTSERWPRVYRALLVPDTMYTARQLFPGVYAAFDVLIRSPIDLAIVGALAIGAVVLIAYAGEWSLWAALLGCAGAALLVIGALFGWSLDIASFVLAGEVVAYSGFIIARFGEVLIFGKRR